MPVTTVSGTIVFTDIVGFTQLTDEHGDDLALTMLERQEELVRRALPDDGAVVKELGDGLMLWFDDPGSAILTMLALQRAFEEESDGDLPMWVRIGMHWGCPRTRGDDIVGRDVNLASRIIDLAGAGRGALLGGDRRRGRRRCRASGSSRSARSTCAASPTRYRSCARSPSDAQRGRRSGAAEGQR